ncbi:kelch repeat-containing protein [Melittangium boletus]|uniref:Kelch repeat-containing protein n=1 Tax=Melittangium boletus TaxID=83453 RepID=UPI003DA696F8
MAEAPLELARLSVAARAEMSPTALGIARVTVTVSAVDMAPVSAALSPTADGWAGRVSGLAWGFGRTVQAQAFDVMGTLRYEGRAQDVGLIPGGVTAVTVVLHELAAPPVFLNDAPLLDALLASAAEVAPGGSVSLEVQAHDPNPGDALRYQWSAPSGRFADASQARTSWTAPASKGSVMLSLTVTDSVGAAFTTGFTVTVSEGWLPTGWMTEHRLGHTATRLADGRVLVARGLLTGRETPLFNAEIYDPATGTWSMRASSSYCPDHASTTLLADGRVFFTGLGPSAEVYDPVADTWRRTRDMEEGIDLPETTLLSDGKVLVVGGFSSYRPGARLYDPIADTWGPTGVPLQYRAGFSLTPLLDGRVLVAGGTSRGESLATAEVYDPATGTWSATGSLSMGRTSHAAVRLLDGRVLVVGGGETEGASRSAEVYDPASGVWSATGAMLGQHSIVRATMLNSGQVLVAGGREGNRLLATAEVYDPASGTWRMTGAMAEARAGHSLTALPDGRGLVVGGEGVGGKFLESAELYVP